MAQGVITKTGRSKLCRAHAGDIALPVIAQMAFGDGGVDADGNVLATTGEEVSLRNELLRKDVDSHSYKVGGMGDETVGGTLGRAQIGGIGVAFEPTTARYSVRLAKHELAGENISEMGLLDVDGDLVAYKTFLPKGKDADMEFIFDMDEIF